MIPEHEEYNQAFHDTDAQNASHYVYHEIQKLYTGTKISKMYANDGYGNFCRTLVTLETPTATNLL